MNTIKTIPELVKKYYSTVKLHKVEDFKAELDKHIENNRVRYEVSANSKPTSAPADQTITQAMHNYVVQNNLSKLYYYACGDTAQQLFVHFAEKLKEGFTPISDMQFSHLFSHKGNYKSFAMLKPAKTVDLEQLEIKQALKELMQTKVDQLNKDLMDTEKAIQWATTEHNRLMAEYNAAMQSEAQQAAEALAATLKAEVEGNLLDVFLTENAEFTLDMLKAVVPDATTEQLKDLGYVNERKSFEGTRKVVWFKGEAKEGDAE